MRKVDFKTEMLSSKNCCRDVDVRQKESVYEKEKKKV